MQQNVKQFDRVQSVIKVQQNLVEYVKRRSGALYTFHILVWIYVLIHTDQPQILINNFCFGLTQLSDYKSGFLVSTK